MPDLHYRKSGICFTYYLLAKPHVIYWRSRMLFIGKAA